MSDGDGSFSFGFFEQGKREEALPTKRDADHTEVESGVLYKSQVSLAESAYFEQELPSSLVVRLVNGATLSQADIVAKRTDLLPGVYEGGLKVWECTYDIIGYLQGESGMHPSKVLDLGCGAGIAGLWILKHWSDCSVTFHDLNKSVLAEATAKNILFNEALEGELASRTDFIYGPWSSAHNLLSSESYDLIITADTLYNPDNHQILHDLLLHSLKPGGIVLIGSKRFYFGVGGGVTNFMRIVQDSKKATAKVIRSFEDGVSNIRDLVEMKRID